MLDNSKDQVQVSRGDLTARWVGVTIAITIFTVIIGLPTYFFICLIKYDLTPLHGNWFLSHFFSNFKSIVFGYCLWAVAGVWAAFQIFILIAPAKAFKLGRYVSKLNDGFYPSTYDEPSGRKTWVRGHYRRIK